MQATDGDLGIYGRLTYTLKGDGVSLENSKAFFSIVETTGEILQLKVSFTKFYNAKRLNYN